MSEEKQHTYFTKFLVAENSGPNLREGYTYLTNVIFTSDLGDIRSGAKFEWVLLYYNLALNELRLECYAQYIDWRDCKSVPGVKYRGQGL